VLVRYNDSRELSSVISDLLLDRERAREMGRKGRARVFDVFDPLLYINGLQDIYGRLFKEKVL
jgi:glycosyltransferase involved in cell wall biosynthesis